MAKQKAAASPTTPISSRKLSPALAVMVDTTCKIAQLRKIPRPQPIMHSTTASMRNWVRMLPRLAPMALRMPISRVRSVTVTIIIFIMPMPPTTREIPAMPPSKMDRAEVTVFRASSSILEASTSKASSSSSNRSMRIFSMASAAASTVVPSAADR